MAKRNSLTLVNAAARTGLDIAKGVLKGKISPDNANVAARGLREAVSSIRIVGMNLRDRKTSFDDEVSRKQLTLSPTYYRAA